MAHNTFSNILTDICEYRNQCKSYVSSYQIVNTLVFYADVKFIVMFHTVLYKLSATQKLVSYTASKL